MASFLEAFCSARVSGRAANHFVDAVSSKSDTTPGVELQTHDTQTRDVRQPTYVNGVAIAQTSLQREISPAREERADTVLINSHSRKELVPDAVCASDLLGVLTQLASRIYGLSSDLEIRHWPACAETDNSGASLGFERSAFSLDFSEESAIELLQPVRHSD